MNGEQRKMKKYLIILFGGLCLTSWAQPSYKELTARLPHLSPYEALYELSEYQAFFPSQPHPYYRMGSICYDLIPTEHPILAFGELKTILYNARLYYGNCLHFAQNQSLKTDYFPGVPLSGGRLIYDDLDHYLRARIDTVNNITARVNELHDSFYELVEQYNRCVALYTDFVGRYDRQKNADLLLTETDGVLLQNLQAKADSLPMLISRFQLALQQYPVSGYQPRISFKPIELYRLDGITVADFLQQEVMLWDYADWTRRFSDNQKNNIALLRAEILKQQQTLLSGLSRWQQDTAFYTRLPEENDQSVLLNRIDRFDYGSFLIPLFTAEQHLLGTSIEAHDALFVTHSTYTDDSLTKALFLIWNMQNRRHQTDGLEREIRVRYSQEQQRKHADFLQRFYPDNSLFDSLGTYAALTNNLLNKTVMSFVSNVKSYVNESAAAPLPALPKKWRVPANAKEQYRVKNSLTQELFVAYLMPSAEMSNLLCIVRLSPEGTELTRLELRAEAVVKQIVQVDTEWLAVLEYEQYAGQKAHSGKGLMSVLFNAEGRVGHINFYNASAPDNLFLVHKLQSNLLAVVSEQDSLPVIRFIDANGEIKK